jgi:uncharacterized Tic20 family protein
MTFPPEPPQQPFADAQPSTPAGPPPGWYDDPSGSGQQRWWDGTQWGMLAADQAFGQSQAVAYSGVTATNPVSEQTGLAMATHLLAIFTGFIGPLIIWFVARDDQPFVKHHAAEALNFQIVLLIAGFITGALMLVLIGFLLLPVLIIGAIVLEIMAAVAANRGEWYRYPLNLRLVPGAQG